MAGERIQTAGYLHTLIGFSIALLHVSSSQEGFNIGEVMQPLGSALITSILGWFAGGELSSIKREGDVPGIKDEMGKLSTELDGFTNKVRATHKNYIKTIQGFSEEYGRLLDKQSKESEKLLDRQKKLIEELINGSNGVLTKTKETLGQLDASSRGLIDAMNKTNGLSKEFNEEFGKFGEEFKETTSRIQENAKAHAEALQGATLEAKNAEKYLSESRVLIAELEKLLNYISTIRGHIGT